MSMNRDDKLLILLGIGSLFTELHIQVMVLILILVFSKNGFSEKLKSIVIFIISISLIQLSWNIIQSGFGLIYYFFNDIINIINSYIKDPIQIVKLYQYVLDPLRIIINYLDQVIKYILLFIKFRFVLSIINNKQINYPFKSIVSNYLNNN